MPWTVTRMGTRMELQFMPLTPPRHADDVRQGSKPQLESLLHLFMLNRRILLTPFHSMMLYSPQTTPENMQKLLNVLDEWIVLIKKKL